MVLTKDQLQDARNRATFFVGTSSKLDDCQALDHILAALDAYERIVALRDRLREREAEVKQDDSAGEANVLSKDSIKVFVCAVVHGLAKGAADEITRVLEGTDVSEQGSKRTA